MFNPAVDQSSTCCRSNDFKYKSIKTTFTIGMYNVIMNIHLILVQSAIKISVTIVQMNVFVGCRLSDLRNVDLYPL